jgi:hypothetical protein
MDAPIHNREDYADYDEGLDEGYGMPSDTTRDTSFGLLGPWMPASCGLAAQNLENLFPPLPPSILGQNIFSDEDVCRHNPSVVQSEVFRKSNYMDYNQFTECKQSYIGDADIYNVKNPPLLIARTIEQQQRRLMRDGNINLCRLIQVVLSNDANGDDFDDAFAMIPGFHIDMQLDFLRRPLLHLLIIDIYNKKGRCATKLRAQYPNLYKTQMDRLKHMLKRGASVNRGGTIKDYSALQIAVYLNLSEVVYVIHMHRGGRAQWDSKTARPYQSSLVQLLISGYYHKDPTNTMIPHSESVEKFLYTLYLLHEKSTFYLDPKTGRRLDPIYCRDINGLSVMNYLGDSNGLSRDFPYDKNLREDHKAYILRDLFVELHDISMTRYCAFMSCSLHSKSLIMPVPEKVQNRLFMQSLGLKPWESAELQERMDAMALYHTQTKASEKTYQDCMDAFMSCNLHSKEWRMPVPGDVRDKIMQHFVGERIVDPLKEAREKAFKLHKMLIYTPLPEWESPFN